MEKNTLRERLAISSINISRKVLVHLSISFILYIKRIEI